MRLDLKWPKIGAYQLLLYSKLTAKIKVSEFEADQRKKSANSSQVVEEWYILRVIVALLKLGEVIDVGVGTLLL